MSSMKETWVLFENYFKKQGKTMAKLGFRPGTSEAKIANLEEHLGLQLPTDFHDFLLICNGQKNTTLDWLPDHMVLFGVDEIIRSWDYQLSRMPLVGELQYNTYQFHDKIRNIIFQHGRIPIAEFEAGTCSIYLDYIAGPKGKDGQLIFNTTECDFIVLTNSFQELIAHYVKLLERGALKFSEAAKGQESKFIITTTSGKSLNGDIWLKLLAGK
jgi:cell wall assembly regulator SMI1